MSKKYEMVVLVVRQNNHLKGVLCLVELFKFGINNCYVLSGEKYAILIDTCPERYAGALFETIKHKNITLLLLTHGHTDHIACTKYIAEKLHIPVAMHQKDYPLIQQPSAQKMSAVTPLGLAMCQKVKHQKPVPFFEPDIFLTHGQRLEEYGVKGKIFALAGHTEGSLGIWTPNKEFFVGDAMMHFTPFLKPCLYHNKLEMEHSFYNICQSDAAVIYMGHGKPIFKQNTLIKWTKVQYKTNMVSLNSCRCETKKKK